MSTPTSAPIEAILFDRDNTLVRDVPANRDPDLVEAMPTALDAVALVRRHGVRTGVATNQAAVGRGDLAREDLDRVNARVDELFGAFEVWEVCEHVPDDRCACRKPQPGMILSAARRLGVAPERCAYIGDIGADVAAATAAGAAGVLVPTLITRQEEIVAAPAVASTLLDAVRMLLPETDGESA